MKRRKAGTTGKLQLCGLSGPISILSIASYPLVTIANMTAATVTGTLALVLLGVATAPSQAFLAGGLCPRPGQVAARPHGTSDSGVRTLAVASQQTPQALPTVKVKEDDNPQGRRWINEVKTGDKVIGYVADTTNFAAFVDVGVVRRGAQVRIGCCPLYAASTDCT